MEGGPSCFPRGFTCPVVLWIISEVFSLRLQGCYLLWRSFPKLFVCNNLFLMICPQPLRSELLRFGLFRVRSPLLAESNFFLFLRVLRCFSSPSSPQRAMYSLEDTMTLLMVSFLIRKSMDQSLRATPHSLSQLITSFIASESQGIRHAPLLTFSLTDNVWSIYTFSFNFTFFCYIMSKIV